MKSRKAYKTVGEVAKEISVNTHTLRFWEKEFKQVKPKLLSGSRRYYSEQDINILKLIYELLKNQGYTIAGAKKLLNDSSIKLDDHLSSGVKRKNFQSSLKVRAQKIKLILRRIKGFN
tara:strand:- start:2526 stop:2879 length:354 start_codon:yes stop_codon:yes gene_type:complete